MSNSNKVLKLGLPKEYFIPGMDKEVESAVRAAVDKLHKETAAAIADQAVRTRFVDFGAEPSATSPDEFGKYISAEIVKWREIITRGGISIDSQ